MSRIRTRFAPSPTGFLHVGGLRGALYSYLFAKKNGGDFLLRIEDTDQARNVKESLQDIIDQLAWAGITFDEGPGKPGICESYIQSERLPIYKELAEKLVKQGDAYYCFCSAERLEKVRNLQTLQKLPPAYDRHCRNLTPEEVAHNLTQSLHHVIRMKAPLDGELTFTDLIRGSVTIGYKVVDDQVLIKSDGFPTYHLAATVDDHLMNISHVIRGEEWLPSTPKHILLYKYFGWEAPLFAHLPLLLNPDRTKISKRHGDVAVRDYRNRGYLPEALVNFVAFLGWNPGDGDTREIFTIDELLKEFSLEHVGKSGAIFNIEKLEWINQQHIHLLSDDELLKRIKPLFAEKGWTNFSDDYVKKVIGLLKERVTVLPDFLINGYYFFTEPTIFDEKTKAKNWTPDSAAYVMDLADVFAKLSPFEAPAIEHAIRQYAESKGISAGKLIAPLRLALTGINQGPTLFDLIAVLGKDVVIKRLQTSTQLLEQQPS